MKTLKVHIESVALKSVQEWAAIGAGARLKLGAEAPLAAGTVMRDVAGRATLAHFAPGRALLPEPAGSLLAQVQAAGGALFDVDGKWRQRLLRGEDTVRLLAAGADVEAMLDARSCAALTLFDCPVIIAREPQGADLWVHASYAHYLDERLAAFAERSLPRP